MNNFKKLNYLNVRSAECTKLAKDFWQNQSQEIVRAGNNQKRHHSLLMLEQLAHECLNIQLANDS